ncbi:MAG: hypothetical protein WBM51_19060, partial [Pseudolabrys sp.]
CTGSSFARFDAEVPDHVQLFGDYNTNDFRIYVKSTMPNLVQPITVSIVLTVQMLLLGYATNQVLAVLLLFLAIFLFAIRPGGAEYGLRLVSARAKDFRS